MNNQKETPEHILQRVKDEIAKGEGYKNWDKFEDSDSIQTSCLVDEVAIRFHSEMLKQLLPTEEEIKERRREIHSDYHTFLEGAKWVINKLKEEK